MASAAEEDDGEYMLHPRFPNLPGSVPLTYTLTLEACLSSAPEERPSFAQILTLLEDVQHEVSLGEYINTVGRVQARCSPLIDVYLAAGQVEVGANPREDKQRGSRNIHTHCNGTTAPSRCPPLGDIGCPRYLSCLSVVDTI